MNRPLIFQGEHTILLLQKKELSSAMASSFFFIKINSYLNFYDTYLNSKGHNKIAINCKKIKKNNISLNSFVFTKAIIEFRA